MVQSFALGEACNILSWNVRGVKKGGNALISKHLKHFFISCIQETRFRDKFHEQRFDYLVHQSFGGRVFFSDENGENSKTIRARSGGVATIVHGSCPGVKDASVIPELTIPNRYLVVRLPLGDQTYYIHNIYAPNSALSRGRFFERLPVDFEDGATHIICGDFNIPIDSERDALATCPRPDSSRRILTAWLAELNVVDAWRLHHPDARVFSGPRPRRNRIDYIFLSDPLLSSSYHDSGYAPWEFGGDHLAHYVELTSWHHPTGMGYWKLPAWLLQLPQLRKDIQTEAQALLPVLRASNNPGIVWKTWKHKMKCYLKRCQRMLRCSTSEELTFAREQLEECSKIAARDDASEQDAIDYYFAKQRYDTCKDEFETFRGTAGFEHTVTETEKSSKFFFRPPQYQLRHTPFQSVKLDDGTESSDPSDITEVFQKHWGQIFGDSRYLTDVSVDVAAQERLLNSINRKLTAEAISALDSDFTSDEFSAAIRSMRPNSAPGPDGFSPAFFQIDADTFGAILLEVFRYQLERGELLPHQRHSSVCLLFKKGDRADPGNFRPITLMPVEVKILSKVITNRLRPWMSSLVHPDQKGFIPGRLIHQQVMLVRDLQHLITSQRRGGLATFLDFAKAYDRVNRPYLFKVLARQGFGTKFLSWIRLLYTDSQCSLMLNGWAQEPLAPSRGVKQGDPLSPFLFALSLEPLGNLLRAHRNMGIRVDDELRIPVAFFADDTVLFSSNRTELVEQLRLVEVYCAGSGAKLNNSKSVIMSLNNHRAAPHIEPLRSLQRDETIKYLGIPFGNFDVSTLLASQLDRKLTTSLRIWKGRARTLLGRRLIVQTVVLSLIWYFTTLFVIPTHFVRRWQSLVNHFVLYNRVDVGVSGINIVPQGLGITPRTADGIGIPVISNVIARQHLMLLQQIVRAFCGHSDHLDEVWYRPLASQLHQRYDKFSRPWSCDFLVQAPPKPPAWRTTFLSPWWRRVVREWKRLEWPARSSLPLNRIQVIQVALFTPLWWNIHTEFQVWFSRGGQRVTTPLGAGPVKFRRLCRALAGRQIFCFVDILDGQYCWPSSIQFFQQICAELGSQLGKNLLYEDIFLLYKQLSQVFHRVLPHPYAGGMTAAPRPAVPPLYGVQLPNQCVDNQFRFFPDLQLQDWTHLLTPAIPFVKHPMLSLGCSRMHLHQRLSRLLWLRRCLLPVVHDVMLRLYFGDIIVGSRLYFLKALNPTIQQCIRPSCEAIETPEHCFLNCPAIKDMWQHLWTVWSQFFAAAFGWRLLLFPKPNDLTAQWRTHYKVISLLWEVHTAIVFHAIWRVRSDLHFRETQAEVPSVSSLLSSFKMHCRYIYRHAAELHLSPAAVELILRKLNLGDSILTPDTLFPRQRIWILRQ